MPTRQVCPRRVPWEERPVCMERSPGWLCAICILSADLGSAATGQLMTETSKCKAGTPAAPTPLAFRPWALGGTSTSTSSGQVT